MTLATKIILNRQIVTDSWQFIGENQALPATGNLIVPLTVWREQPIALTQRAGNTGVWLKGSDDPAQLQSNGAPIDLPLIAVEFSQFVDGRGYSIGRLLRERYGFKGELRAIGDVLRDQLSALARCGFNSFALKEGKSLDDALKAFDDFSDAYQNAVDQPAPYYRRRLEGTAATAANGSNPATAAAAA